VTSTDLSSSSAAEKTAAVAKVRYLERELFDDDGHIRKRVTAARADEVVAQINHLRQALGWLEINLDGRWRWPASTGAASAARQRVA
jgi:hypothetical protein